MSFRKYSHEDILVLLSGGKHTLKEVAAEVGCSVHLVAKVKKKYNSSVEDVKKIWLKKNGSKPRIIKEELQRFITNGVSLNAIAEAYGYKCKTSVTRLIASYGLSNRQTENFKRSVVKRVINEVFGNEVGSVHDHHHPVLSGLIVKESYERIKRAVSELPERNIKVLRLLFGERLTLVKAGEKLDGQTRERVRQLRDKALRVIISKSECGDVDEVIKVLDEL